MRSVSTRLIMIALLALAVSSVFINCASEPIATGAVAIPKTWDDRLLASLELPLANADASPVHISSAYYYRIPVRPIYKSYPVYASGREPVNYIQWLNEQEPQETFDPAALKTQEDWIKAGEVVFDAPITYGSLFSSEPNTLYVRDATWLEKTGVPVARDGMVPFYRYVIREKGKIEIGVLSCAMCHTRVMPDRSVIKGAQGNFPFDRAFAYDYRAGGDVEMARGFERSLYAAPWMSSDPCAQIDRLSKEEIASRHDAIPPGVMARHGASPQIPVKVADLIGVKERKYLDATGLIQHRDTGDLMRYAALNQDGDFLARHKGFIPQEATGEKLPADASTYQFGRYSDEQLYALALYLYSLKPPPNPNRFDAVAAHGQKIFEREGCASCHAPPLYTNNYLTIAEGFEPPKDHFTKYAILPVTVETDSGLALRTRRGTGYYKVPSLRGVWYRGPFEHNGSVATLEDWFDPRRLRDDYVPTGFRGQGVRARAIRGHRFGLDSSAEDRKALIAFLKTL